MIAKHGSPKGIIDVKEQIQLINVMYFTLEHFMSFSILYIAQMCTISNNIAVNEENEACLTNKSSEM